MKPLSSLQKGIFVVLVAVVLVLVCLFVKKLPKTHVKTPTKLDKLPKPLAIPRKITWHWVLQKENKPLDFCVKSQNLIESLCSKAEQEWACNQLYEEAREEAEKQWFDKLVGIWHKQCDAEDLNACWSMCVRIGDCSASEQHNAKRAAIWQKQCDEENNANSCIRLYWYMKADSRGWGTKRKTVLQKQCEQKHDFESCQFVYNLVEYGSPEQALWKSKLLVAIRKNCEEEEGIDSCLWLKDHTEGSFDMQKWYRDHVPKWQERCQQKNDMAACQKAYDHMKTEKEKQQWHQKLVSLLQQPCEQNQHEVACHILSNTAKKASLEQEQWNALQETAWKQKYLTGKMECTQEAYALFSQEEELRVLKIWEDRCQENAEDCKGLFDLYELAGSCQEKRQKQRDQEEQNDSFEQEDSDEEPFVEQKKTAVEPEPKNIPPLSDPQPVAPSQEDTGQNDSQSTDAEPSEDVEQREATQ